MAKLRVEKHPDKTFIGRIAKGFDFLGYWFSPSGLGVAKKTVSRMLDKVSRLDEQGADDVRIETYLKRWWQWVRSGVDGVLCAGDRLDGVRFVRYELEELTLLYHAIALYLEVLVEKGEKIPQPQTQVRLVEIAA